MGSGLALLSRKQVLKEVTEKLRPIAVPRAGDVLSTVVNLIPRDRAWTVRELKSRVEESGSPVADKELYNAIGYLTRKHHIQRVGPGRYVINGHRRSYRRQLWWRGHRSPREIWTTEIYKLEGNLANHRVDISTSLPWLIYRYID